MRLTLLKPYIPLILTAALCSGTLTSCKPTEKGYRSAYEAAKNKREQADPDLLLLGGHKLLTDDATNWKRLGGDSLQVMHIMLKPDNGAKWPETGPYRLAVAMFKMTTNANSMLKDLEGGKLRPVSATDGKDRHYIIAGSATYADSLANVLATFRKEHPGFRHIGMPGEAPVVIVGK